MSKAILEEVSIPDNVKAKDLKLWNVNFDENQMSNSPDELLNDNNEIKMGSQKVGATFYGVQGNNIRVVVRAPVSPSYTASDGHSVELPPQIIDMLESDKFVPDLRTTFRTAFQNIHVGQSITLLHLGQEPKHFAEGYQGRTLLITGQMIDIWDKLSADSDHSIKRVFSGPMGVDISDLNVESSKKAGDVICRYFLALNKDILTATDLKRIIRHVDYDSKEIEVTIAEEILDLIKLADRKALLIVDEHESFKFACVILTGTAHARYERKYMKNGQYEFWVIYVGLLQSNVFDILLQLHSVLRIQGIKEEAKKVTNSGISIAQINGKQIDMYLDEMHGPSHSAKIDSQNRFVIIRNGIRVSGFRIVYIRGSLGTSNHSGKVREFSNIALMSILLSGGKQSSSKITEVAKETSNQ
ncbi:1518_t:CDS:2, partial [Funneliformis caledonium]